MEKVFLVDAYALIFRFYYAFIGRPMRNAAGVNTSAVFGFVKFLKDLILRERPHYLGVAFDPPGGNFRHELYADYKANRSETPEDIVASVPYIKQVLEAMRIPVLEIPGYEADDVIGTLSQKAAAAGYEVFMVTPDKDYGQLIRPAVRIYKQRKGGADGIEIIGCEQIREHYGIDDPCRVIDVLALWGDASDNIPGVQGIGEKSAIKLVCQFGTVENLLAHTELLSGKQRVNIEAARDQIMLAKRLATIRLDVPVEFEPEKLRLEAPDTERLAEVYRELGFRSFLAELRPGAAETAEKSEPASPQQSKSKTAVPARDLFSALETPAAPAEGSLFDAPAYQTIDTVPHVYHTVTDEKALRELAGRLEASSEFCFDTETTGFDVFGDRLVGLSFAVEPFEAWYVPCDPANLGQVLSILRPVFENERIAKIGQNVKFDLMMLRSAGIDVRGTLYDTMIVHYLLDPESRHGMDHLARICLNYSPGADRGADRQGGAPDHDGPRSGRALRPVRGRGRRRDAAAEAALVAEARGSGSDGALSPHRGTADPRAGRHRDDRREDRFRGAGCLGARADLRAGRSGGPYPRNDRRPVAERQFGQAARRRAVRPHEDRSEAAHDQNEAISHGRGVPADACRPGIPSSG